ncbi:hypothetical protein REPUB_Repub11eG0018200 [Reevesia pubescens]
MASKSSWSDLPEEILRLIFDCAKDPVDILRCGAACKSWLPVALQFEMEAMVSIPESFENEIHYRVPYLVKLLDDHLFLVGDSIFASYSPDLKSFEIFEFDICNKEFKEVNDLGGCALFVNSDGNHILAKTGNSETWFKANYIYKFNSLIRYFLIYDYGTRNSELVPSHFQDEYRYKSRSLWVNPDV